MFIHSCAPRWKRRDARHLAGQVCPLRRGCLLGRRSRLSISHQVGGLISGFSFLHAAKVGPALEAAPSPPSARDDGVKAERVVNPKVVCFALEAEGFAGSGWRRIKNRNCSDDSEISFENPVSGLMMCLFSTTKSSARRE